MALYQLAVIGGLFGIYLAAVLFLIYVGFFTSPQSTAPVRFTHLYIFQVKLQERSKFESIRNKISFNVPLVAILFILKVDIMLDVLVSCSFDELHSNLKYTPEL